MKRRLTVAVLVSIAIGSVAGVRVIETRQTQRDREDEAAIRGVITEQTRLFNEHEVDRTLFTEDADFVNAQGVWLKGAAEIERARKMQFQTALRAAMIKLLDVRVRFLRPDVAIAHASYEIAGMVGFDGRVAPPHEELSVRVLVRNNGRWLVSAFHITTASSPLRPH